MLSKSFLSINFNLSEIINCVFVKNYAYSAGGGVAVNSDAWGTTIIKNSILWDNDGMEIYAWSGQNIQVSYCDVQNGYTGTSNIDSDPLFVDVNQKDFHLQLNSPCIDQGDPDPQYDDPDGTRNDMGVYYYPHSDIISPSSITDLSVSNIELTYINLTWTAPGDDGNTGLASQYDIRYYTSPIDNGNWDLSTQVTGEPAPHAVGYFETFTVTGLSPYTYYYFAIKTADEVPNWSVISNVVSCTMQDTSAPTVITDLRVNGRTGGSVTLLWTTPGDNGDLGTARSEEHTSELQSH